MTAPNRPYQPPQNGPGGQPQPPGQPYPQQQGFPPGPPQGGPQPPFGGPFQPPPPRQRKVHPVLIVIGVVLAGFVGLAIIGALIGPDADPTASQTTQTTPEPTSSAADKPDATPAEAKPKAKSTPKPAQPKPKAPGLNQAVRDGDFTFTVTKVEYSSEPIGSEYLNTKPQGQFVLVHMTVANHGTEAGSFFGDNQYALDAGGRQFSADTEAGIYLEDSESLYEEINPGNKVTGIVIFDVPKGTKIQKLELHDSAFSDGVTVTVG